MLDSFFAKKMQTKAAQYVAAHPEVKLVVVAGSIGKATTRRAVASVLSKRYRVRMHDAHRKSPLYISSELLGLSLPEKPSILEWIAALRAATQRIQSPSDVDIIIQEINTAAPGDFAAIGAYIHPALSILTGITPEQIEVFGSFEAVAQEYMSIGGFSDYLLINRDDIDVKLANLEVNPNFSTYGTSGAAEYRYEIDSFAILDGYDGRLVGPERQPAKAHIGVVGEHMVRAAVSAYAAAVRIGMEDDDIVAGLGVLRPLPGRMNPLKGIDGTIVIDDTHDARPASVAAALQTLYTMDVEDVPQRIAVLGDIQNLGNLSKDEHEKLGMLCDPSLVTWFVLVGHDMEMYLAPKARARGCQVHITRNAIEAGEFVRSVTETGATILVTGAAALYLEETVKTLCDMDETTELVRQSPEYTTKKNAYFSLFT
jgi:UDP-N-acetylmuramyl pentapeptide synthase